MPAPLKILPRRVRRLSLTKVFQVPAVIGPCPHPITIQSYRLPSMAFKRVPKPRLSREHPRDISNPPPSAPGVTGRTQSAWNYLCVSRIFGRKQW